MPLCTLDDFIHHWGMQTKEIVDSTYSYDFHETSANSRQRVVKQTKKSDFSRGGEQDLDYTGKSRSYCNYGL